MFQTYGFNRFPLYSYSELLLSDCSFYLKTVLTKTGKCNTDSCTHGVFLSCFGGGDGECRAKVFSFSSPKGPCS